MKEPTHQQFLPSLIQLKQQKVGHAGVILNKCIRSSWTVVTIWPMARAAIKRLPCHGIIQWFDGGCIWAGHPIILQCFCQNPIATTKALPPFLHNTSSPKTAPGCRLFWPSLIRTCYQLARVDLQQTFKRHKQIICFEHIGFVHENSTSRILTSILTLRLSFGIYLYV